MVGVKYGFSGVNFLVWTDFMVSLLQRDIPPNGSVPLRLSSLIHLIPNCFYPHELHLLFDSLHVLRQLLYCARAVFRLDFRLYQFLWVFLPCMDIHIGFQPVIIAFIPAIFKYRGNFAF